MSMFDGLLRSRPKDFLQKRSGNREGFAKFIPANNNEVSKKKKKNILLLVFIR